MEKQKGRIFELYKPLRNYLREFNLAESLYVIWAYCQNLQFGHKLPSDIQAPPGFLLKQNRLQKGIYEWELETIAKEVVINSEEGGFTKSLKEAKYFSRVMNRLKELENEIAKDSINEENILLELHRMAHRQFIWQTERPNKRSLTRYYKVFGHKQIDEIIRQTLGIGVKKLYITGNALLGNYLGTVALNYPPDIQIKEITLEHLDRALECFSLDLKELKQKLVSEQQMDENLPYLYSSLRAYPIIRMVYLGKDSLVCPLPTLLFWRLTHGIYYEICDKNGFDNAFGESFQNYIGEVIKKSRKNDFIKIFEEEEYFVDKARKDTVDWIVDDPQAAIFVECKTKKITQPAKITLSEIELKEQLDFMADFIVQIYKTIEDYENDRYPSYKFNEQKEIFPLVVTLEDWHLFGAKSLGILRDRVKEIFKDRGLPLSWLESKPYSICSTRDFENIIQIIQHTGIERLMGEKAFNKEMQEWEFGPFLNTKFKTFLEKTKFLFEEDLERIFTVTPANRS